MKVKEIMTRDVATVGPEAPVTTVARILRKKAISGMPVVDDDGRVIGIITEVDLIARHARPHFPAYFAFLDGIIYLESTKRYHESMRHILATTAGELMTSPAQTVDPEMDVQDLATFMVEERVNPVPVVDKDHRLVGIVSHTDVLQMIERAEAAEELSEYASQTEPQGDADS
jgi:CBS domain-containing protein